MAALKSNTCGYACVFIEAIPEELQTECSICLHTVRDPHMVDCCGYRFCKACIEPLRDTKRCPLCNCKFTTVILDKLLRRMVNQKLVYCANKEEGCEWIGELCTFDKHINAQPEPDKGCSIQKLKCEHCRALFRRHEINMN